ncbi:hypothetical protein ELH27_36735 [Rhizobium leguminosarum]|uniref:Uncharacterized protein n=1 Tax=Rhizobium beringeri TaxID=3019934 RepID=A0ABY1XKN5_9HYPH|nr:MULTISPECIES: hypothetical protein [Rhizobium]TAU35282.1 hypothetical protein ELI43_37090 [Rhizobium leguminosarum]TBC53818.1 hypothetical protein ELH27_36735 [Rhizobium leguminosarum]TBE60624.1 hypothetical protein ELH03_27525 [Rhizobium beringeri]
MTKWIQVLGAGVVLLAAVLAAIVMNNYREAEKVTRQYVPPKGIQIAKGSGPLGCDFSGIDSPIITGVMPRVGEPSVKLQVPKAYLPGPFYPKDGTLAGDGTLLLMMKADGFDPYPVREQRLTEEKARQQWLMALIWQFGPLEGIAQSRAEFDAGAKPGTKFEEVPQANGLIKYEFLPRQNKQVYIARDSAKITDVVECDVNTGSGLDVSSPGCKHMTSASGLDVSISYYRTRLDDWGTIKERMSKFLACMIID